MSFNRIFQAVFFLRRPAGPRHAGDGAPWPPPDLRHRNGIGIGLRCPRRPLAALLAASILWLPLASCRRSQPGAQPVLRLAILPFEDHSPDASASWLARLLPFSLRRQMESLQRFQAAEVRSAADFPAATHELTGFLNSGRGRLEAHLFLYDLPAHKLLRQAVFARPAGGWRELLEDAAKFVSSSLRTPGTLHPPTVKSEAAARSLAQAIAASSPAEAAAAFRAAAIADPACGWCWLGWAETTASAGDRDAALAVLEAAAKQRGSLDPLSLARLDLLAASMKQDRFAAAAAIQRLAAASPSDPFIQLRLSESLVANRKYGEAEKALRNALATLPAHAPLWNSLAYALAWQGRFDQALEAVRRYEELDSGPNPADSRGEILMMAGRFREAAEAFAESYQKAPAFNGGAAMEKAAICWLLEGDSRNAAASASRFVRDRAARNDAIAALAQARWELLLGRSASSASLFARAARDAGPLAPLAASMLALRLAFSDPAAAARWLPPAPLRDGAQELYRAYAAAALDPSSAEKSRDARLQLELRALSLTARREWRRAADAWQAVIDNSPGATDAPYRELRAFCLVNTGQTAEAGKALGGVWPLLAPGQMELYDFLVYPALLYTRAEIASAEGRVDEARRLYDIFLVFAGDRQDLAAAISRARAAARL